MSRRPFPLALPLALRPALRLALLVGASTILAGCTPSGGPDEDAAGSAGSPPSAVASLTADGSEEGYERADRVIELTFPADHGPHPDFQTEWWYLTANLESESGRRYGLQWTLFRRALEPTMPPRESAWATRQIYLGHFAVTDAAAERHHSFERLARGAAGLAGSRLGDGPREDGLNGEDLEDATLRVWLEDWSLTSEPGAAFPWTLRAAARAEEALDEAEDVALELRVEPAKPLVLQGDRGYSQKNSLPGGASYYYSFTRLEATGELTLGDRTETVHGTAWLDREWSTSVLAPGQIGWDWFALQLDDDSGQGRDLMVYELRLEDGGVDPASKGVLVGPQGEKTLLAAADYDLDVLERWTSPEGATYPVAWRLRLPEYDLDLEVRALFPDQELDVSFRYWEGAVDVVGRGGETGRGYAELVGYGD